MADFGQFALDLQGCGSILTAGSCIAIGELPNCLVQAPVYTLTADAATAIGETTISFTATVTAQGNQDACLGKGKYVYFNGNAYRVVSDATVVADGATSNQATIEPAEVAIAISDTADSWLLVDLTAPTDLPLNSNDTLVDTTDLKSGIQGSEQKTNVALESQVQAILKPNDKALGIIHDATQIDVEATVVIARTGGIYAIGRAILCNLQYSGNTKEVVRPQFQVKFQPPYSFTKPADQLSVAELATLNGQLQLAGLPTV